MKLSLRTSLAACLLVLASCGGGGVEDLKSDARSEMNAMITALESIKDKDSLDAAQKKLEGILENIKSIDEKVKALPEEDQKIFNADDADMDDLSKRMMAAVQAASQVEGANDAIMKIMSDLPK